MSGFEYRSGLAACALAMFAATLFILDLVQTPSHFENGRFELAFAAPMVLWLLLRGIVHQGHPHR